MADSEMPQELLRRMASLLRETYAAGHEAGAAAMRVAILQAASGPAFIAKHADNANPIRAASRSGAKRAPRGSVRHAIVAALTAQPGLSEFDLGQAAARIDPSVSAKSTGGELRRMKGRLYRVSGGRWFLIAQPGETETAGDEPPADPEVTAKGASHESPLAA